MNHAQERLDGMLEACGIRKRSSYVRAEVCEILGISERSFWRFIQTHEDSGSAIKSNPWTIDAYMTRGHHRVTYDELVSWLARNRAYERKHKVDTLTMDLPGFG